MVVGKKVAGGKVQEKGNVSKVNEVDIGRVDEEIPEAVGVSKDSSPALFFLEEFCADLAMKGGNMEEWSRQAAAIPRIALLLADVWKALKGSERIDKTDQKTFGSGGESVDQPFAVSTHVEQIVGGC